jgi:hypothetical protein
MQQGSLTLEDGISCGLLIQNHFQELCGKEILKIKLISEHCEEKFQTVACQECEEIFCDDCFTLSHQTKKKKSHKPTPLQLQVYIPSKCSKHPKQICEFYCLEENEKICYQCIHESHKNHKYQDIQSAATLAKSKIDVGFLKDVKNKINDKDEFYDEKEKLLEKNYETKKKKLEIKLKMLSLKFQTEKENLKNLKSETKKKNEKFIELFDRVDDLNDNLVLDIFEFLEKNSFNKTIMVCGKNDYGQLGLGHTKNVDNPTILNGFTNIDKIFAGNDMTFLTTKDREVYSCGKNTSGQLGLGDLLPRSKFTEIKQLNNKNIIDLKFGNSHVLALSS